MLPVQFQIKTGDVLKHVDVNEVQPRKQQHLVAPINPKRSDRRIGNLGAATANQALQIKTKASASLKILSFYLNEFVIASKVRRFNPKMI